MPYDGDSPIEAWEYWFDTAPSIEVLKCLMQRIKTYSLPAVVDAIQIAGSKALELTDDTARLQYVSGVLRRKQLAAVLPERAEEERKIDFVRKCWHTAPFTSFPLDRKHVRQWLSVLNERELAALINLSHSWTTFKELMSAVQMGVEVNELKALHAHADTYSEFRELVAEAVRRRGARN